MNIRLDNKVALVTGSSSGIGKAIALAFARAGAAVTVNYHRGGEAAQSVRQQIEDEGGRAVALQADVSKVDDVKKLVDKTVEAFGRLDVMVNNAGTETRQSLLDATERDYDLDLGVNLKGAFFGTKFAAEQMIRQGDGGRIINTSSVHEQWPMPGNAPYCCAKGGMQMLTRNAGYELAKHGIGVVAVGPGAIATPLNEQTLEDPQAKQKLQDAIPAGRIGQPDEVADLVLFLASEHAGYILATTFFIDGGLMHYSPGL